jgi:hypothetical protein
LEAYCYLFCFKSVKLLNVNAFLVFHTKILRKLFRQERVPHRHPAPLCLFSFYNCA